MKNKSDAISCFKEYEAMATNRFNRRIIRLRCDNGKEYINEEFMSFCKSKGTVIEKTIPYTPQQNGKSERMNRTLVERACSLLHDSKLPKNL